MSKIKIANAPCSWGVLEFDLEGESTTYEQVLDEIAETGYLGTELGDWGFMPTDPAALNKEIEKRKLDLLGAFVPIAFSDVGSHQEGIERAVKTAQLMRDAGFPDAFIVLADNNGSVDERVKNAGRIPHEQQLPNDLMKVFAEGVNKTALAIKEKAGLRTVFHHHAAGYIETPEEIERLLRETDPDLVGLCFDTGHFLFGGGRDIPGFMTKYWDRIWHVHFKDFSTHVKANADLEGWDYFQAVQNGIFCELGTGAVNFTEVKQLLEDNNYHGWIVVEQDVLPGMGQPKQCAQNNRRYLKTIGL